MSDPPQKFASDNYSGICPEAWAAMAEANQGHQRAYGEDQWTARAAERMGCTPIRAALRRNARAVPAS